MRAFYVTTMTQQGQPELTLLRRTGQAAHAARGGDHTIAPLTFRRKGASINQGHDEAQDLTNQLSQLAPTGLLTRTRISGIIGPACRVGPAGLHEELRKTVPVARRNPFFTTFEQLELKIH